MTTQLHSRMPFITIAVLGVTIVVTAAQFVWPEVLETLRRAPDALQSGQWWRILSPLFVHAYGWPHLIFNLSWIAPIGVVVERRYGHLRWLILYFASGVIGELAGLAWEPHGAGASLGGSGLLGGLAAWLIARGQMLPWRIRWWGPLIIVCAVVLTFRHDIHGPPMLAGAVLGLTMERLHRRSVVATGSDQPVARSNCGA